MTADDRPLGHPDARLVELLAQTEELRVAPPLRPAGSAEARLVEDFIADHAARRAGRGLFQGEPVPERNVVEVRGIADLTAAYPIPDPLGPVTVDTLLTNPDRLGTRLTVDQMLDNPDRIARRLAEIERTHELGRALFPPGLPLTRWQRARLAVVSRLDAARERVALSIAPWLEDHDR